MVQYIYYLTNNSLCSINCFKCHIHSRYKQTLHRFSIFIFFEFSSLFLRKIKRVLSCCFFFHGFEFRVLLNWLPTIYYLLIILSIYLIIIISYKLLFSYYLFIYFRDCLCCSVSSSLVQDIY